MQSPHDCTHELERSEILEQTLVEGASVQITAISADYRSDVVSDSARISLGGCELIQGAEFAKNRIALIK